MLLYCGACLQSLQWTINFVVLCLPLALPSFYISSLVIAATLIPLFSMLVVCLAVPCMGDVLLCFSAFARLFFCPWKALGLVRWPNTSQAEKEWWCITKRASTHCHFKSPLVPMSSGISGCTWNLLIFPSLSHTPKPIFCRDALSRITQCTVPRNRRVPGNRSYEWSLNHYFLIYLSSPR